MIAAHFRGNWQYDLSMVIQIRDHSICFINIKQNRNSTNWYTGFLQDKYLALNDGWRRSLFRSFGNTHLDLIIVQVNDVVRLGTTNLFILEDKPSCPIAIFTWSFLNFYIIALVSNILNSNKDWHILNLL